MKGLLYKDFKNTKKEFISFVWTLIIFNIAIVILSKIFQGLDLNMINMENGKLVYYNVYNPLMFLSSIFSTITIMIVTATFGYDDQSKWQTLENTLPITKKDVVKSKYVFAIALSLVGTLLGGFFGAISEFFMGSQMNTGEFMLPIVVAFLVALFYNFINIPILYFLGTEGYRRFMIPIFIIPIIVAILLEQFLASFGILIMDFGMIKGLVVVFGFYVLVLAVTYFGSVFVYSHKEY